MKSRFAIIAMIAFSALVISTFATLRATQASAHDHSAVIATEQTSAENQTESLPSALTPDRPKFQVRHVLLATTPNFGHPISRTPIRRKGRIQH